MNPNIVYNQNYESQSMVWFTKPDLTSHFEDIPWWKKCVSGASLGWSGWSTDEQLVFGRIYIYIYYIYLCILCIRIWYIYIYVYIYDIYINIVIDCFFWKYIQLCIHMNRCQLQSESPYLVFLLAPLQLCLLVNNPHVNPREIGIINMCKPT